MNKQLWSNRPETRSIAGKGFGSFFSLFGRLITLFKRLFTSFTPLLTPFAPLLKDWVQLPVFNADRNGPSILDLSFSIRPLFNRLSLLSRSFYHCMITATSSYPSTSLKSPQERTPSTCTAKPKGKAPSPLFSQREKEGGRRGLPLLFPPCLLVRVVMC